MRLVNYIPFANIILCVRYQALILGFNTLLDKLCRNVCRYGVLVCNYIVGDFVFKFQKWVVLHFLCTIKLWGKVQVFHAAIALFQVLLVLFPSVVSTSAAHIWHFQDFGSPSQDSLLFRFVSALRTIIGKVASAASGYPVVGGMVSCISDAPKNLHHDSRYIVQGVSVSWVAY